MPGVVGWGGGFGVVDWSGGLERPVDCARCPVDRAGPCKIALSRAADAN